MREWRNKETLQVWKIEIGISTRFSFLHFWEGSVVRGWFVYKKCHAIIEYLKITCSVFFLFFSKLIFKLQNQLLVICNENLFGNTAFFKKEGEFFHGSSNRMNFCPRGRENTFSQSVARLRVTKGNPLLTGAASKGGTESQHDRGRRRRPWCRCRHCRHRRRFSREGMEKRGLPLGSCRSSAWASLIDTVADQTSVLYPMDYWNFLRNITINGTKKIFHLLIF